VNAAIPEGVDDPARPELIHPQTLIPVPEGTLRASSTQSLTSADGGQAAGNRRVARQNRRGGLAAAGVGEALLAEDGQQLQLLVALGARRGGQDEQRDGLVLREQ